MRLGIIDLGTNSVRFDVQWLGTRSKVRLLHREKLMVRLGQGVFVHQKLNSRAKQRTIEAFLSFRRTANRFQVNKIIAFATSAMRVATDSEGFVKEIKKKTGMEVRVISGNEEAQLIALGILSQENTPQGRFGLIDIGGGSTEISICKNKTILRCASFPLGTARLQQLFLKESPPLSNRKGTITPIEGLRNHIRCTISAVRSPEKWPRIKWVVGSSGTIRAIEKILKKRTSQDGVNIGDLSELVNEMGTMNKQELAQVPGMEAKRVDMILSGAILLEESMKAMGAKFLMTTNYSLRDGILERELNFLFENQKSDSRFQLNELYQKAVRFGLHESTLRKEVSAVENIFDQLKRIHGLNPDWKRYLSAAVILQGIGNSVSPTHFETHSYYMIQHADFLAMEKWESDFIALLCLNSGFPPLSKKSLSLIKEKTHKETFLKILSLLQFSNSLYQGETRMVSIESVKRQKETVKIQFKGQGLTDLQLLRVNQIQALFEKTFKCKLEINKR